MKISTSGDVPIILAAGSNNMAIVAGTGTLAVSGNAWPGFDCEGFISGVTLVEVFGYRDAAYTYELTLTTTQNAVLTVKCSDKPDEVTPLPGSDTKEVTLSSANGYSVKIEESDDDYEFVMNIELMNPYMSLPEPQ